MDDDLPASVPSPSGLSPEDGDGRAEMTGGAAATSWAAAAKEAEEEAMEAEEEAMEAEEAAAAAALRSRWRCSESTLRSNTEHSRSSRWKHGATLLSANPKQRNRTLRSLNPNSLWPARS